MASPYANSPKLPPKNEELITTKIPENQSEIPAEFQTSDILGIKYKVLRYFDGNSQTEVERHFRKAFYTPMANNPREIEVKSANSLPMRQRKLPASFWSQGLEHSTGTDEALNIFYPTLTQPMFTIHQQSLQQHNIYTTHHSTSQLQNYPPDPNHGQLQYGYSNAPLVSYHGYQSATSSRLIAYSKLPTSAMVAPNVTITDAQIDSRPRCSIPYASSGYYNREPSTGHGFNPRYNRLLIQPDVMLQLPLIHGQARETSANKG